MSEVLEVARTLQSEYSRVKPLIRLVSKLKTIETDITIWEDVLHTLAYLDRKSFLADTPNLAPVMIRLSGDDTAVVPLVVEAMRDVCSQWP